LKVLLNLYKLDTPFTGGLGSYKLYVLVAYHIREHLAMGGQDRPGEVLLSFLFRYGQVKGHNVSDATRTTLHQYIPLQYTDTCSADLSNVYLLEHCVHLFRRCWERLWKHLGSGNNHGDDDNAGGRNDNRQGLLMHVIDAELLNSKRQECLRKAAAAIKEKETAERVQAIHEKREREKRRRQQLQQQELMGTADRELPSYKRLRI